MAARPYGSRQTSAEIEREIYAKTIYAVLANPIGLETIDWEIADAVIALNHKRKEAA